ncbi:alpha,alpha-trehalase [Mucilaginibacter gracilis]|uniref:Alpha,alpha-trehalase n=1 Tax=Mucilaginibacter gracilis TaxID=423350 RepID=A0A495IWQ5_9SPHI|nr:alpha,alpha-trehalase TreF [Mucilaginibacter gracilis]RKR80781.1 alpha,alpha-trehalase [Mucilaginibacter gracilis]
MKKSVLSFLFFWFILICQAQTPTPRQLYPGLFEAIQSSNVFPDNKTFVDVTPRYTPEIIMQKYREQKAGPDFNLKAFVAANFKLPATNNKGFVSDINAGVRKHIDTLWKVLQREPDTSINTSLLPLPHPYIVPGGRFREVYYWDSYFTMLGLQQSHQTRVIDNMISNFAFLIDTYGFIPNGNRSYYLTRSQPPFFSLMVKLLSKQNGPAVLSKYQPQLLKEYQFWMGGEKGLKKGHASRMVVRMAGGEVLNRYWDAGNEPREESYIQDVTSGALAHQDLLAFYKNVRSAAASGWDFSSRWFGPDQQLASIQTTNIVPVDLNCLMYHLELTIAQAYNIKGNTAQAALFKQKANRRKAAILKYCWDEKSAWFNDYYWQLNQHAAIRTLAAAYPLEFGIASPYQAKKIAAGLKADFLKPGGLVTTLNHTGQQWDAPNGWAPLQYIAIDGLEKYKFNGLAKDIALRWINLNKDVFKQTGKLMEKYNVEDLHIKAGGGEYPLQDGFGWTNGVLLTLMNRYHVN